ncbi:MAG: flavodoxin family protein [Eubacterium sp.]|nr:flavodoxin family protein [Eubacterium sp.]
MKVVVINGSPRKNGVTAEVLHLVENELVKEGVDVEFYNLSEINMSHCIGCCSCYKTGHCCISDDAEMLSQKIFEADGLVLGFPTYASNVSGLMKDFIDRGHFVIEQMLHGKYCVTIATGENYGNKDALKVLNNLVLYSGGKKCYGFAMNIPFNNTESVRKKLVAKCYKASERLIKGLKKRTHHPIQTVFNHIVISVGIRPLIKRKGSEYQGVIDKWTKLGIY